MSQLHCNLSIIVHYQGNDFSVLKEFFERDLSIFPLNGTEVIFFLEDGGLVTPTLSYMQKHSFFNWKLFHAEIKHRAQIYGLGLHFSRFKKMMFISLGYKLKVNLITDFLKYSNYYDVDVVIGSACDLPDINQYPYQFADLIFFFQDRIRLQYVLNSINLHAVPTFAPADLLRAFQRGGATTMVLGNAFCGAANTSHEIDRKMSDSKTDVGTVCYYDYQEKSHLNKAALDYFAGFEEYCLKEGSLSKKYRILTLVSIYNEKKHLKDFLENLSENCDGIVVLDDGSDDSSYGDVICDKVVLKIRKKRNGFDDLENRNILLKLAFFFDTNWILFMDADERISGRFEDLRSLTYNDGVDVYLFNFVNLWDSSYHYRKDMAGVKGHDLQGIYKRYRMFRDIGYTQISLDDDRRLHFPTVPYLNNSNLSKVLVYHLGLLDLADRVKKYNFYQGYDHWITKNNYRYLLDDHVIKGSIGDISASDLDSSW